MIHLTVEKNTPVRKMKPMHGLDNAPMRWANCSMFHYLTEAGIPVSRLHDTGGLFGGGIFVDIANIFPNFAADSDDPAAYEFAFTDHLIKELVAAGIEPFYRLGCSIENDQKTIAPRRIFPPANPYKWADICAHIMAHYNRGWADGYRFGIRYWEIWNEPDNEPDPLDNPMWRGDMQTFFELYEITANRLKRDFPECMIGGYASCGFYEILNLHAKQANVSTRTEYFIEFFEKFLAHITTPGHEAPLDFFSWHSYSGPEENVRYAAYARKILDKYGFTRTESILNEWNPGVHRRGALSDASAIGAMMVAMQNSAVDMLAYYDGQVESSYCGLFEPMWCKPLKAYYTFKAFNMLYRMGTQYSLAEQSADGQIAPGLFALAAGDGGGREAILLVNRGTALDPADGGVREAQTAIAPAEGEWTVWMLDETHDLEVVATVSAGAEVTIPAEAVVVLERVV